ncbi:hypothetical protein VPH35_073941 [Triticum aestivum]
MSSCNTPRENTMTFGAHRGVVLLLCYHAAAGFAAGGTIFVFPAAASRRLSGSARGLDFDPPMERPCGTARPRRRPHPFRHHHCDAGRLSARATRGASPRSVVSIHASLASAPLCVVPCSGRNARLPFHISSIFAS